MDASWIQWEPKLRWYLYLFGFAGFVTWETLWPRKTLVAPTGIRWAGQILLLMATSAFVLSIIPIGAIEVSVRAAAAGRGILPHSGLPLALQCIVGVLILDFVRFLQHWCYHASDVLWRIHRIHHSDPDFDLTTGLRVHPLEPFFSVATYLPVIWLFGIPTLAVMPYELARVLHAFFSHANIVLPQRLDQLLRLVLVTPEYHRVHHSDRPEENRHNYGEMFTLWDPLFRTRQAQPADGHERMGVGMKGYRGSHLWNPIRLIGWPFYDRAVQATSATRDE